jgi:broad specificity phosphatase PhoE
MLDPVPSQASPVDTQPLPQEITLVRHGATEWSKSGQHTGRTNIPLDEDGRTQAVELGERLADMEFDLVLTSPLSRARETAQLAGYGEVAEAVYDLHEWDYGQYEGRTSEDIRREQRDWSLFNDGCPNGESASDVGSRADRVLSSVRGFERVAIFSHGHFLRVFAARWLELPPDQGRRLKLDTATISMLGWEHEHTCLLLWNS